MDEQFEVFASVTLIQATWSNSSLTSTFSSPSRPQETTPTLIDIIDGHAPKQNQDTRITEDLRARSSEM